VDPVSFFPYPDPDPGKKNQSTTGSGSGSRIRVLILIVINSERKIMIRRVLYKNVFLVVFYPLNLYS